MGAENKDINPPTDAAAAAAADASKKKKKKERVVHQPVPPACVSTAYVLLRGVVAAVLGCPTGGVNPSDGDCVSSLMQPSYLKDGYPSGKFSVGLGKKNGTACVVNISEDDQDTILDAIETAINDLLKSDNNIELVEVPSQEEAIERYGHVFLDQSQLKAAGKKKKASKKGNTSLKLAYVKDFILAVPPGPIYSNTLAFQNSKIVLERTNESTNTGVSSVTANKKKCELVIKFRVLDKSNDDTDDPSTLASPTDTSSIDVEPLLKTEIRHPEGLSLQQKLDKSKEETTAVTDEAAAPAEEQKDAASKDMKVNAFEVSGIIDYDKLVDQFGSKIIDEDLMKRLERLTVGRGNVPYLHRFLRRNIFFSHRDLHRICDCLENNEPMYLYTGRGPSSSAMHLGHLVPFLFTQWLQQAFQCPLVIQMTDDEKFLFKGSFVSEQEQVETGCEGDNLNYFANLTMENARDIIACGFDKDKTFIFSDLDYVGSMYPNIVRIWKAVTTNTVQGIFGFDGSSNIGKVAFPAIQAAPSFASSFPVVLNAPRKIDKEHKNANMACLIPCAIDQDPYFRMTRDVAHKLVHPTHPLDGKPALIHSKFFPPLQGSEGKMSSSDENSAIFLTDTSEDIKRKIKENAFSGGQMTKALQQKLGADLEKDVSYQWLRFFLEDDDELEAVGKSYGSGQGDYWSTGLVKERLVQVLQEIVGEHQARREHITDDVVRQWMSERCLV